MKKLIPTIYEYVDKGWSPVVNYFVWYVSQRGYKVVQVAEKI